MSIDLFVYVGHTDIAPRERLAVRMRELGWEIAFVTDWQLGTVAKDGPIGDDLVVGWLAGDPRSPEIRAAVLRNDSALLQTYYNGSALASCTVDPTIDTETDDSPLDSARSCDTERATSEYKMHYYLRTSGGRSPLSFQFQRVTWLALAQVTGGLACDAQSGDMILGSKIGKRDFERERIDMLNLASWCCGDGDISFVERAKNWLIVKLGLDR